MPRLQVYANTMISSMITADMKERVLYLGHRLILSMYQKDSCLGGL